MEPLKLCVVGQRRHGKDTVCELLERSYGLTFISSSYYCCQKFIFNDTKDQYGYTTVDECFEDRHDKRADWFQRIKGYIQGDEQRLAREILETHNVYCGMRNGDELKATRDMFDAIVWVDASKRCPGEGSDSMTITEQDAHCTIYNNGSEEHLIESVHFLHDALITRLENMKYYAHTDARLIFGR